MKKIMNYLATYKVMLVAVGVILASIAGLIGSYKNAPPADYAIGAIVGPEVLERMFFKSGIEVGSVVTSTTTAGSAATLVARDITGPDFTRVTIGGAVAEGANFTYTLPASTTLRHFLPRVGDSTRKCFMLTATTSDSVLIFAGGTGLDVRTASTTATGQAQPTLGAGVDLETCFTFTRRPDNAGGIGSITAHIESLSEAD